MAEKIGHELSHLQAEHCDVKGTHFCEKEHACHLCDYIFSSSVQPSPDLQLTSAFTCLVNDFVPALAFGISGEVNPGIALRGPPIC